jgi:hypothetical protein
MFIFSYYIANFTFIFGVVNTYISIYHYGANPADTQTVPFHHLRLPLESIAIVPGMGDNGSVLGAMDMPPLTLVGANEAGASDVAAVDNPKVSSRDFPEPSEVSTRAICVMVQPKKYSHLMDHTNHIVVVKLSFHMNHPLVLCIVTEIRLLRIPYP